VRQSTITVLVATLLLAGCGSQQGQKTLAMLKAECIAGNLASCAAAGLHPQVVSDDVTVAASIDAALREAVIVGMAIPDKSPQRDYALRDHAKRQP
jgi:uncharacterized lipoprotein YmbA